MSPDIDFCPGGVPGHGQRFDEMPFTDLGALTAALQVVLQPLMTVPFAFFGHSTGACLAFEAARVLRAADGRSATHLFVSGRAAPGYATGARPIRSLSDQELMAVLIRYGGTPSVVIERKELMAALLPSLRADLELVENHRPDARARLSCPIIVFGGTDDTLDTASLQAWSEFTAETFRVRMFPGGHFYFFEAGDALIDEIVDEVRRPATPVCVAAGRSNRMRPRTADRRGLRHGEVHVWLAPLVEDEERTAGLLPLLDREEAARAARFSYAPLRMHFVQSHEVARRILAEYAGADPTDLVFARGRHGKPRLIAPAAASRLQFSLSHGGDCCILAVRRGQPVGVDIERRREMPRALDIARRNFTASEIQMLARLPAAAPNAKVSLRCGPVRKPRPRRWEQASPRASSASCAGSTPTGVQIGVYALPR